MTPSVRTRKILIIIITFSRERKKIVKYIVYYIDRSGAKHVSKEYFRRYRLKQ